MINEQGYRALLRTDLGLFIERSFNELNPQTLFLPNWHIELIASELEACARGETKRLIINVPPRSLKSHCVSIAFVAWLLGHKPSAQTICVSYAQDLADKLAMDCRTLIASRFYMDLFRTRLSIQKRSVEEFTTTENGFRMATSIGGVLTGRGADFIIIDDPLKPEESLSETQRQKVNDWYDHTLYTRLNDKQKGCIIIVMQRLHEDDLVGHVTRQTGWKWLRLPAIAEEDEMHVIRNVYGERTVTRYRGEALHVEREPLGLLAQLRETQGEYNFAGQYQQAPAPLEGGLVKAGWFKSYGATDVTAKYDFVFQSWDTANKATELSDFSVCTTWGVKSSDLYLLNVYRRRLEYPDLRRAVRDMATAFKVKNILVEDKASGTQLIQDLIADGIHGVTRYQPTLEKIIRMHSVTSTIENGFVYLPETADWLAEYLHELVTFPKSRFDDQADSTSQALDWFKMKGRYPAIIEFYRREVEKMKRRPQMPSF